MSKLWEPENPYPRELPNEAGVFDEGVKAGQCKLLEYIIANGVFDRPGRAFITTDKLIDELREALR